ncbi:esterase/lipase family protein [Nocardia sp. CA-129566]|uniref:esterase/lipase family protein n=1 Tax=Nocardia sp. CA-129566 TaxID=3239976 RepID=UPI003D993636
MSERSVALFAKGSSVRRSLILPALLIGAFSGVITAAHADDSSPDGSTPPAGANDWDCRPSAAHPEPVVLVHGTWGNQNSWDVLAPQLKAQGYCVFSLSYGRAASSIRGAEPGVYGTEDIRSSAREVGGFVDLVRAATGVPKVDIVAHSQGGPLVRQFLRFEGGANYRDPTQNKVDQLITIAATNHGTTAEGLGYLLPTGSAQAPVLDLVTQYLGTAALQQLIDSEFLHSLNAGGDTEPGIRYTVIASHLDRVVTPPEATFLTAGLGATVDNIWVQDLCPDDDFNHGALPESPTVGFVVQKALDPSYTGLPCPG